MNNRDINRKEIDLTNVYAQEMVFSAFEYRVRKGSSEVMLYK